MKVLCHILWIDCSGGLLVGGLMLLLSGWLKPLYQLPAPVYEAVTCANLAYGTLALLLALHTQRSPRLVMALALANGVWSCLCLVAAALVVEQASFLATAHLLLEGCFVLWLCCAEWRYRNLLAAG